MLLVDINNQGLVSMNLKSVAIDQVYSETLLFLNGIKRDRKRFLLRYQFSNQADLKSKEKVIKTIITAHLAFIEEFYEKETGQNIHQATKNQLDNFKIKHSMGILFDDLDYFQFPPPPPAPDAPIIDYDEEEIEIELH